MRPQCTMHTCTQLSNGQVCGVCSIKRHHNIMCDCVYLECTVIVYVDGVGGRGVTKIA